MQLQLYKKGRQILKIVRYLDIDLVSNEVTLKKMMSTICRCNASLHLLG